MKEQIILGSQSPRRADILRFFSIPFLQVSPHFDEESIPFTGDPIEYVKTLASCKARSLIPYHPDEVIVTADTTVYKNNKIFNKPKNTQQALEMLTELNGGWHSIFTAVTACRSSKIFVYYAETRVLLHACTHEQLKLYVQGVETLDKAGGYAIQGVGGILVKRIEGCFYNVMGLPLSTLAEALKEVTIDLWHSLV